MRRLYADDSYVKRYPNWQESTLRKMRMVNPAAIIIGDSAINGTKISRFSNWASQVCTYVSANYESIDKVLGHTVYVRRDIFKRRGVSVAQ